MKLYENMFPKVPIEGHRGYYPVCNKEEWDQLPDLYKVMEWEPVKDPFDKERLRAVKAVVFDVIYMEPYGVNAKVAVHPQEVQKILFCSFDRPECHLYSICEVELEGGNRLPAKWYQDSYTGAFGIYAGRTCVARQGGFEGFIPERIEVLPDGTFKYDQKYGVGKTHHFTLSNPFKLPGHKREKNTLNIIKNMKWDADFDIPKSCGAMTVQVGFSHKENSMDETEFCVNAWDAEELTKLFGDFCKENRFEDVSINSLEVVRVAASIDELTKLEEMDAGAGSCLDDVIKSCEEVSKNGETRTETGSINKER